MSEPLHETEYLRFVDIPPMGSTRRIIVEAKKTGAYLGDLRWFGRWRQFVFEPQPGTLFNVECMNSLADRLGYLNTMHRRPRAQTANRPADPAPGGPGASAGQQTAPGGEA